MTFENAKNAVDMSNEQGLYDICVPYAIDTSLHTTNISFDFYRDNHNLIRDCSAIADPEVRMDMNDEYMNRILGAAFLDRTVEYSGSQQACWVLYFDQGDPFDPSTVKHEDLDLESPVAGNEDLKDYIRIPDNAPDNYIENRLRQECETRVRHFFVLTRVLAAGYTVNYVVDIGHEKFQHQVGLRREDDKLFITDIMNLKGKNAPIKRGPYTLREICGIDQEPFSQRPKDWPSAQPLSLRAKEPDGDAVVMMIYPPESDN